MVVAPRSVTIRYKRLPDNLGHFEGVLLQESSNRLIVEQYLRVRKPRKAFGNVIVADGYLTVWFIFRKKWYDVGKFYDQEGTFTGYYCDIIRPVARLLASPSKTSIITDLFLDLWINRDGRCLTLDENQLEDALADRIISKSLANKARGELDALVKSVKAGTFPPRTIKRFLPRRLRAFQ